MMNRWTTCASENRSGAAASGWLAAGRPRREGRSERLAHLLGRARPPGRRQLRTPASGLRCAGSGASTRSRLARRRTRPAARCRPRITRRTVEAASRARRLARAGRAQFQRVRRTWTHRSAGIPSRLRRAARDRDQDADSRSPGPARTARHQGATRGTGRQAVRVEAESRGSLPGAGRGPNESAARRAARFAAVGVHDPRPLGARMASQARSRRGGRAGLLEIAIFPPARS